jgi:uncharacterized protein involved in type VI secretion and phage assembly
MPTMLASPLEQLFQARQPAGLGGCFYGVFPALVSDICDEDNQGRVKILLPWSPDPSGAAYECWARLATTMAGGDRGTWFVPDVHDEVLVAFEGGDPSRPYVIGGLWNGSDSPPDSMDKEGKNFRKVIRSRNGVQVTLDDKDGQEKFLVKTPGGQQLSLKDGPGSIEIVDSNGNSLKMEAAGITLSTSAKLTINAQMIEISAPIITANAGMSNFSGTVRSDTVQSNTVISASITPCAGNIW